MQTSSLGKSVGIMEDAEKGARGRREAPKIGGESDVGTGEGKGAPVCVHQP